MSRQTGVWIDHRRAVIVCVSDGHVTTETLESGVAPHDRFSSQLVGGGEKKYEQQHAQSLDRYYDDVISHMKAPERLLICGPGEAKSELKARLGRSAPHASLPVDLEAADALTDVEVVQRVKEHFGIVRG